MAGMRFKLVSVLSAVAGVVGLAILAVLVWSGFLGPTWLEPFDRSNVIKIADGGSPLSALLYVAQEKGFFLSQGVIVQLAPFNSGREALAYLLEGKADLATVADSPIAAAIMNQKSFKIAATIGSSDLSCAIVTYGKIQSPLDLVGRKVGYLPGTTAEFFLHEFLVKNRIPSQQVSWIPIDPEDSESALLNGRVDAIATWEPFVTRIGMALNHEAKIFKAPDIYKLTWNLVAASRFLKVPEPMVGILKALALAEEYTASHSMEVQAITGRYLRTGAMEVKQIWPRQRLHLTLEQLLILNLERQTMLKAKTENIGKSLPDFDDYVYYNGMESIFPERVTVIR